MGRNTSPRAKRSRRIGEKLITHGEKALSRRPYPPGQHGPKGAGRSSEYGVRLREKQKAQLVYGLLERQFRKYFEAAKRRTGNTGENLLQLLELRLDNVVFRAGFGGSHESARQLVRHAHITVNGKRVTIPSYQVKVGDTLAVGQSSQSRPMFQILVKQLENYQAPAWLELNRQAPSAKVISAPTTDDLGLTINPQLIVEFYSR